MFRKSNETTLKQAIQLLLETYQLSGKLKEVRLVASWEGVVGPMIAKHTKAVWIKDRKLYVRLDSAALRMELGYARQQLVEMLNTEAGDEVITDIVLK